MIILNRMVGITSKAVLKRETYLRNLTYTRLLSYISTEYHEDPAPFFFKSETQVLLKDLTRIDLNKVNKKRKLGQKALEQPVYKFMTDEQLQKALSEAKQKVDEILQMPPVIKVRKPIESILSKEPALQGLDPSIHVFTDITFGVKDAERLIVIRETDGTLKKADWPIRDRVNQLYFPKIGRTLRMPHVFEENQLNLILDRKEYKYVLDRACIQFEPDDPEYQRVTSITYQHINDANAFDLLRSTRHFGPLAFFLSWFKNIDNLVLELIETLHLKDVSTLLNLYGIIHKVQFKQEDTLENLERYILEFAKKKAPLELALQAYKDLQQQKNKMHA